MIFFNSVQFFIVWVFACCVAFLFYYLLGKRSGLCDSDACNEVFDYERMAYLSGGARQWILYRIGLLLVDGRLHLLHSQSAPYLNGAILRNLADGFFDSVDQTILKQISPLVYSRLRCQVWREIFIMRESLMRDGLLLSNSYRFQLFVRRSFVFLLVFLLLLVICFFEWVAVSGSGLSLCRFLLISTGLILFVIWLKSESLSVLGVRYVDCARLNSAGLKRPHSIAELPKTIAVFGGGFLIGTSWHGLHYWSLGQSSDG